MILVRVIVLNITTSSLSSKRKRWILCHHIFLANSWTNSRNLCRSSTNFLFSDFSSKQVVISQLLVHLNTQAQKMVNYRNCVLNFEGVSTGVCNSTQRLCNLYAWCPCENEKKVDISLNFHCKGQRQSPSLRIE